MVVFGICRPWTCDGSCSPSLRAVRWRGGSSPRAALAMRHATIRPGTKAPSIMRLALRVNDTLSIGRNTGLSERLHLVTVASSMRRRLSASFERAHRRATWSGALV